MKLFITTLLVAVAMADRLDNTYLPPGNARSAGGNGNFLGAPRSPSGVSGSYSGASARQQSGHGQEIPILRFNNENNGDGNYQFEYETANGIQAQEAGQLRNGGSDAESIEVRGSYTYTGDDGQQYTVTYTADENGFQPQGAHLPTPPPIPEAILRSLEQNAAEEARGGPVDDGSYQGQQRSQGHGQRQQGGNGGYRYETANGIQAQEAGQLRNGGSDAESIEVRGSYTYTGDDGQQYTVTYTADENGFQPQGAHLPTPPPIPEAILRSLEQNAAEEARGGPVDDGSYQGQQRSQGHGQRQQGGGNGGYRYETANGIQAQEAGQLRNGGSDAESIEVRGSYTYTGDDGQQYTVTYTADENGFQPQGAHLPTPPPIPEAILRSLEQNAAEEARGGPVDDGSYQGQQRSQGHGQRQQGGNGGYRY